MWRRLSRLRQRGAHGTDDWLEDFLHLSKQQTLLRFDTAGWRDRWSLHCDAEYGGSSTVELQQGEAEGEGTARFAGQTVTEIDSDNSSVSPETGKRAVYAGWAAMRTDVEGDGWDLKDFHGIRLRVRPDGRGYMLNLRTVGILGGEDVDIYQARMPPSPVLGDWCELRLPFSAFVLTSRGYVQHSQAMNLETLKEVGLLVADKHTAPFELEIAEVEAFRFEDEEAERDAKVAEMLRLNEELGYAGV